jgi:hypothetical protein
VAENWQLGDAVSGALPKSRGEVISDVLREASLPAAG